MATLGDAFSTVHSALVERFGAPEPVIQGREPFEGICDVLLARKLGPEKTTAIIGVLRESDFLTPSRLATADVVDLTQTMAERRLSVSAAALAPVIRLARWLVEHHGGRISALFDPHRSTEWLRGELTALKGIGAAGADAVLLYALTRPAYPVDRATFRVLVRHDWLDPTATYDEARDLVVDAAASQEAIYDEIELARNEFLAADLVQLAHGMDQVGRHYCRPAAPRCDDCPLASLLPEGGYRQVDA